uniref:Uncharacterized protein n=1 Tax=Helianthus annuus TaxID=4232 RepID=A0A251TF80_HELAN
MNSTFDVDRTPVVVGYDRCNLIEDEARLNYTKLNFRCINYVISYLYWCREFNLI